MLFVAKSWQESTPLILVHFDLEERTYDVLDHVNIPECVNPQITHDGDIYGLFYITGGETVVSLCCLPSHKSES